MYQVSNVNNVSSERQQLEGVAHMQNFFNTGK